MITLLLSEYQPLISGHNVWLRPITVWHCLYERDEDQWLMVEEVASLFPELEWWACVACFTLSMISTTPTSVSG